MRAGSSTARPWNSAHRRAGVFWLASGCHEGTYFLTAFSNPSDRFENIGMGGRALNGGS